ncbi:unnamed protein product [Linum trigynum]|uniref:Uncharacterized protein n=1 Tax=Linum trigynum TaxID=586398 RepID=A0AAV2DE31_9ROSI
MNVGSQVGSEAASNGGSQLQAYTINHYKEALLKSCYEEQANYNHVNKYLEVVKESNYVPREAEELLAYCS